MCSYIFWSDCELMDVDTKASYSVVSGYYSENKLITLVIVGWSKCHRRQDSMKVHYLHIKELYSLP